MSDYDILDPRFGRLIIGHAKLEQLWTGGRWVEGPVWVPAAKMLLFSDIPNNRVMRFDQVEGGVSVFETPCGFHNGHALDNEGRVIACEHGGRRVSRLEHNGKWVTIADRFEGKRLNSPNDVVVKSDGSIWFTDPSYGIETYYEGNAADGEIGSCNVYRVDPTNGVVDAVITDYVRPNGLAFSTDEMTLYVAESGTTHVPDLPSTINAHQVNDDEKSVLGKSPVVTSGAGLCDGFRIDNKGNIWTSSADSVRIHAPDGTLIGRIPVPELVSNVAFGGRNKNRLFITAQTSLYAIYVNAHAADFTG